MVGIFSRFSGGHRRAQSTIEGRETAPPSLEVEGSAPVSIAHAIEIAVELKPIEHPTEPLNRDQPVKCPLPEPSILNDGRIWKERMSSVKARTRADLQGSQSEPGAGGTNARSRILPSFSAPEHNLINMLEECTAAGDPTVG